MRPIAPSDIWAIEFQFDQTSDLCTIKMLIIIDEFARECLAIDVSRSITSLIDSTSSRKNEAHRVTCSRIKVPSWSRTLCAAGVIPTERNSSSSIRVRPSRTAGSNRSTLVFATSS